MSEGQEQNNNQSKNTLLSEHRNFSPAIEPTWLKIEPKVPTPTLNPEIKPRSSTPDFIGPAEQQRLQYEHDKNSRGIKRKKREPKIF